LPKTNVIALLSAASVTKKKGFIKTNPKESLKHEQQLDPANWMQLEAAKKDSEGQMA